MFHFFKTLYECSFAKREKKPSHHHCSRSFNFVQLVRPNFYHMHHRFCSFWIKIWKGIMPRNERKRIKNGMIKEAIFFLVVVVHIKHRCQAQWLQNEKPIILILHFPRRFYIYAIQCVVLFFSSLHHRKNPHKNIYLLKLKLENMKEAPQTTSWNLEKKIAAWIFCDIWNLSLFMSREKKTFMKAHTFAFGECQFNFLAKPQIHALHKFSLQYRKPTTQKYNHVRATLQVIRCCKKYLSYAHGSDELIFFRSPKRWKHWFCEWQSLCIMQDL